MVLEKACIDIQGVDSPEDNWCRVRTDEHLQQILKAKEARRMDAKVKLRFQHLDPHNKEYFDITLERETEEDCKRRHKILDFGCIHGHVNKHKAMGEGSDEKWKCPHVIAYTLESPLCYEFNEWTRQLASGRDILPSRKWRCKAFGYQLRKELLALPRVECDVFRAFRHVLNKELYRQGRIVTWPTVSSAVQCFSARVLRGFLKEKKGDSLRRQGSTAAGASKSLEGTIVLVRAKTARKIAHFSQNPSEEEVVLLPMTQFRVRGKVSDAVKSLLEKSMRHSLSCVEVYELTEVRLLIWTEVLKCLSSEERSLSSEWTRILTNLDNVNWANSYSYGFYPDKHFSGIIDPASDRSLEGPSMEVLPLEQSIWGKTLLHLAVERPSCASLLFLTTHRLPPSLINTPDSQGTTALHYTLAQGSGHDVLSKQLLLKGAQFEVPSPARTPSTIDDVKKLNPRCSFKDVHDYKAKALAVACSLPHVHLERLVGELSEVATAASRPAPAEAAVSLISYKKMEQAFSVLQKAAKKGNEKSIDKGRLLERATECPGTELELIKYLIEQFKDQIRQGEKDETLEGNEFNVTGGAICNAVRSGFGLNVIKLLMGLALWLSEDVRTMEGSHRRGNVAGIVDMFRRNEYNGMHPLIVAAQCGRVDVIEHLLEQEDISVCWETVVQATKNSDLSEKGRDGWSKILEKSRENELGESTLQKAAEALTERTDQEDVLLAHALKELIDAKSDKGRLQIDARTLQTICSKGNVFMLER